MALKDMWQLGSGWKVTVAATTVAALGGAALASPGFGGDNLPPIDLDSPAIVEIDDDPNRRLQMDNPVMQFDLDSSFASADTSSDSTPTATIGGPDDTDDTSDDSVFDDSDDTDDSDDASDDSDDPSDDSDDASDDSV